MRRAQVSKLFPAVGLAGVPLAGFAAAAITYVLMASGNPGPLRDEAQLVVFAGLTAALAGACVMLAAVATPTAIRAWREADLSGSGAAAAAVNASLLVIVVMAVIYVVYRGMLPQTGANAGRLKAAVLAVWAGVYMVPAATILRVVTLPTFGDHPLGAPVTSGEIRDHQTRAARIRGVLASMSLIVTLATAGTNALLQLLTAAGPTSITVLRTSAVTVTDADVNSLAALYGLIYATGLVFAYLPARIAVDGSARALIDRAHSLPFSNDESFSSIRERREELQLLLGLEMTGRQSLESTLAILAPLVTGLAAPLLNAD